jgi:hypothetical protein
MNRLQNCAFYAGNCNTRRHGEKFAGRTKIAAKSRFMPGLSVRLCRVLPSLKYSSCGNHKLYL